MWGIEAIHWISVAKHLQGPTIHSLLLIFDIIISNHLNTFGRKVIVVYENVFPQKTSNQRQDYG